MDTKLKRNIYTSSKLSLDLFLYEPEIKSMENSDTLVMNYIPSVTIIPIKAKGLADFNKDTFKFYPRNYWKILNFFEAMVSWFYDKSMNDLFLEKDGKVIFNYDYKDLHAIVETRGKEYQMMKGMPTIVEYDNNTYEAVIIYINNLDNNIVISFRELEDIYHTIKSFNFQTEVTNALLMLINERQQMQMGIKKQLRSTSQFNNSFTGKSSSVAGSAINPFKI